MIGIRLKAVYSSQTQNRIDSMTDYARIETRKLKFEKISLVGKYSRKLHNKFDESQNWLEKKAKRRGNMMRAIVHVDRNGIH